MKPTAPRHRSRYLLQPVHDILGEATTPLTARQIGELYFGRPITPPEWWDVCGALDMLKGKGGKGVKRVSINGEIGYCLPDLYKSLISEGKIGPEKKHSIWLGELAKWFIPKMKKYYRDRV